MIRFDPSVFFIAALLLLTLPMDWVLCAVCAAAVHELCHIAAIQRTGGKIYSLTITPGGAVIETVFLSHWQELICAVAGPAGSWGLLLLRGWLPKLAVCGAVQGICNLIPIYPLDGGRILHSALLLWIPKKADRVQRNIERILLLTIGISVVSVSIKYALGILPVVFFLLWTLRIIRRKIPCKQWENRVQ